MDWTAASVVISAIGIIVTIVLSLKSASKKIKKLADQQKIFNEELRHNRFLQERDIAIRLLHENEFEPKWLEAKRAFFENLIYETNFDWEDFSRRKFSSRNELDENEKKFGNHVTVVLNRMEFVCVAILTGAANEDIIKATICKQLTMAYNRTQPYIDEARRITDDQNAYCNLETVAKNWNGDPNVAMEVKF